ncbi:hypothetical protein [Methylorubrum extorquens]|uniref:hypothetical protein n=1 Tax=Methylorubrum extorquens TaxID=408 RepID=UPI0013012723|nr:hypothetical protein [Methylorubrum extorquens]MCP1544553.1 putative nucleic-acid-binding Zn-ribbon protein [Methylorubrum extorquens]MCP1588100.1 putative nucleic-acid-binding Zn-ribbon protein [Methylorubrum extorquens]
MTDEVSSKPTRLLTFDDFVRFANEKGISKSCPACGTQNWVVSIDVRDSHIPAIIAKRIPDNGSEFSLPVVLNECSNCGYLRLFQRDKVEEFLNNEEAKTEESELYKADEEYE